MDLIYPEFFSKELKDLISKLLVKKQEDRMPLKNVLDHPWIKKNKIIFEKNKKLLNEDC